MKAALLAAALLLLAYYLTRPRPKPVFHDDTDWLCESDTYCCGLAVLARAAG